MTDAEATAFAVLERISIQGSVHLEELAALLPTLTWNQMFAAIDRLSREGKLEMRHPDRGTYVLALKSMGRGNRADPRVQPHQR